MNAKIFDAATMYVDHRDVDTVDENMKDIIEWANANRKEVEEIEDFVIDNVL